MKIIIAKTLTLAVALVGGVAVAGPIPTFKAYPPTCTGEYCCTANPAGLGQAAAEYSCEEIASGYLAPSLPPEVPCSTNEVIDCKNAMASYRRNDSPQCDDLIQRDVQIVSPSGQDRGSAQSNWRSWVMRTCNMR